MAEEFGPEIQKVPGGLEAALTRASQAAGPHQAINNRASATPPDGRQLNVQQKGSGGSAFSHVGRQWGGQSAQQASISSWRHCPHCGQFMSAQEISPKPEPGANCSSERSHYNPPRRSRDLP